MNTQLITLQELIDELTERSKSVDPSLGVLAIGADSRGNLTIHLSNDTYMYIPQYRVKKRDSKTIEQTYTVEIIEDHNLGKRILTVCGPVTSAEYSAIKSKIPNLYKLPLNKKIEVTVEVDKDRIGRWNV